MTATRFSAEVIFFPYGIILPYAGRVRLADKDELAKCGWYLCDGKSVLRTLAGFDVIGTLYGVGDSVTTFNVPDFRGRFLRAVDDPTGTEPAGRDPDVEDRTGNNGGAANGEIGSIQDDAFQGHLHSLPDVKSNNHEPHTPQPLGYESGHLGHGVQSTGPSDGRNSSETRPKNVYINYIIYLGV